MNKLKSITLTVLLGLSLNALAQSDKEYVDAVGKEVKLNQFASQLVCGEYSADVEVRASGIKVVNLNGPDAYKQELLRAANAVHTSDSPVGLKFPVVYSKGACRPEIMQAINQTLRYSGE